MKNKHIPIILVVFIICSLSINCFATEIDSNENIIIIQFNICDNQNKISVSYGYPTFREQPINQEVLIDDSFELFISELSIDENRYDTINCVIEYENYEDLHKTIQFIKDFPDENTEWIRFHFYMILDNIVSKLNQQTSDTTLEFFVDTNWMDMQSYHMMYLDNIISNKITDINNYPITAYCFFVIPSNLTISGNFELQECKYSDTEMSYRAELVHDLKIRIDSAQQELTKLDQFLNSKWYYLFLIGSGLFIVISIVTMLIIARSFNNVVEKEEKLVFEKTDLPTSDVPELYLSKEQRAALEKNGLTTDKKNIFQLEDNPHKMESIDYGKHRKNK